MIGSLETKAAPLVLIIDDEPAIVCSVERTLKQAGYRVHGCSSVREAIIALGEELPDVIVLDHQLPGKSSADIFRALSTYSDTSDIATIYLSGRTDRKTVIEGLNRGAVDWISKPVDPNELVARIAAQIRLRQLFREKLVAEKALSEHRTSTLGILAHDVRSPLTSVLLSLEQLELEPCFAPHHARIQNAKRRIEQIVKMAESALCDAKSVSNGREVRLARVDLKQIIHSAADLLSERASLKEIALAIDVPSEPSYALSDLERLAEILENLLTNAIKYSHRKTTTRIGLVRSDDRMWQISVSDQGVGISEDELPLVFNRFVQLSSRPTEDEGSVGLGLSITKALVGSLGGSIVVKSDIDRGTTFTFTLPALL